MPSANGDLRPELTRCNNCCSFVNANKASDWNLLRVGPVFFTVTVQWTIEKQAMEIDHDW